MAAGVPPSRGRGESACDSSPGAGRVRGSWSLLVSVLGVPSVGGDWQRSARRMSTSAASKKMDESAPCRSAGSRRCAARSPLDRRVASGTRPGELGHRHATDSRRRAGCARRRRGKAALPARPRHYRRRYWRASVSNCGDLSDTIRRPRQAGSRRLITCCFGSTGFAAGRR